MWLQVGLASGAAAVILYAIIRGLRRRPTDKIDVGSVSESWLADHRARRNDPL
jgi:hypothetical protein